MASPFDLHVLSTPPAFILSQDQTLEKNLVSVEIAWSCSAKLSTTPTSSLFDSGHKITFGFLLSVLHSCSEIFSLSCVNNLLKLIALAIYFCLLRMQFTFRNLFRVALLFICQGSEVACLIYQTRNVSMLSQPPQTVKSFFFIFFNFFNFLVSHTVEFYFITYFCCLSIQQLIIILIYYVIWQIY